MKAEFNFLYEVLSQKDLSENEKSLFDNASIHMEKAYAPYSNFLVGAALLLDNGKIIGGSNQENAAYPLCMCAERVALYSAISQFPEAKGICMAIVANNMDQKIDKAIPPCGSCRQVILEFENRYGNNLEILLKDDIGRYYKFKSIRDLLPLAFDSSFLD